jgi:hypothetical protein
LLEQHLELDWLYADEAQAAQAPAALIPPPQDELAALGELVAIGDILALQERAAQLEQRDPQWRAFARELARLAGQFELEQLRALLNQYLPIDITIKLDEHPHRERQNEHDTDYGSYSADGME